MFFVQYKELWGSLRCIKTFNLLTQKRQEEAKYWKVSNVTEMSWILLLLFSLINLGLIPGQISYLMGRELFLWGKLKQVHWYTSEAGMVLPACVLDWCSIATSMVLCMCITPMT